MPWQPVIDGDRPSRLPHHRDRRRRRARRWTSLVGTNTDDWRLFLVITGAIGRITDQILTGAIEAHGYQTVAAYGLPIRPALAAYRAAYPGAGPGDLLAAVQTDWWCASRPSAWPRHTRPPPRARTCTSSRWSAPGLGAVHALEIPFVFDALDTDAALFGPLLGTDPPAAARRRPCTRPGSPSPPTATPDGRSTSCAAGRPCASTRVSEVVDDPRSWERTLWEGIR